LPALTAAANIIVLAAVAVADAYPAVAAAAAADEEGKDVETDYPSQERKEDR